MDVNARRAREVRAQLAALGVRIVAVTWVDNAGITRAKAIPLERMAQVAVAGIGVSPVFDLFGADDSIAEDGTGRLPVGDLRLYPDLDRAVALATHPGWAWAPGDRLRQDGSAYPGCGRGFARRAAASAGLDLRMAFETEWYLERRDGSPATRGPAYGLERLLDLSGFAMDLLAALDAQGVPVAQFHPEAAPGQFELSVAPADPVRAADRAVLVRLTIRAVAAQHGLRVSFAPCPAADELGNGVHLHLSPWRGGANLLTGGTGPYGMTADGQAVLARLLVHLDALCAITAPSLMSYRRLRPGQWAGAFRCWGHENREAAVRLVTSPANLELRCVDGSANAYLVAGAVSGIIGNGGSAAPELPAEVTADPATLPEPQRPPRLPMSLAQAVAHLATDETLGRALGEGLRGSILRVRRAEIARWVGQAPEELIAATRWRY